MEFAFYREQRTHPSPPPPINAHFARDSTLVRCCFSRGRGKFLFETSNLVWKHQTNQRHPSSSLRVRACAVSSGLSPIHNEARPYYNVEPQNSWAKTFSKRYYGFPVTLRQLFSRLGSDTYIRVLVVASSYILLYRAARRKEQPADRVRSRFAAVGVSLRPAQPRQDCMPSVGRRVVQQRHGARGKWRAGGAVGRGGKGARGLGARHSHS